MSNDVRVFNFKGQGDVRVVVDGKEWFVAKDVCVILGLSGPAATICQRIPDKHKGIIRTYTPGGPQKVTCVDEAGLYRLILRSDKPEAEEFLEWVTAEVLPSIRRTGRYEMPAQSREMTYGETILSPLADGIVKVMDRVGTELGELRRLLESVKRDTQPVRVLTVSEFLRERGIVLDPEGRKELGGVAKKLSTERGFPENRTTPSKLYPRGVNKYRMDVLEEVIQGHLAIA